MTGGGLALAKGQQEQAEQQIPQQGGEQSHRHTAEDGGLLEGHHIAVVAQGVRRLVASWVKTGSWLAP